MVEDGGTIFTLPTLILTFKCRPHDWHWSHTLCDWQWLQVFGLQKLSSSGFAETFDGSFFDYIQTYTTLQIFWICVRQKVFLVQLSVKLLGTSTVEHALHTRCPNDNDCSHTLCPCRLATLQRVFEHLQNSCTALFVRACQQLNHVKTTAWMSWRAAWLIKLIWIQSGTNTLVSVFQLFPGNSHHISYVFVKFYAQMYGFSLWLN